MSGDETDDGSGGVDRRSVERDVESCASSHRALDDRLDSLSDVDPARPSRLPGWSVGHVLTHIARNGDSHLAMLAGDPQYPSVAARNADIDAGAKRPWADLIADVRRAGAAVDAAYRDESHRGVGGWDRSVSTLGGDRPAHLLPLLRQREVEIHRIDLGLGDEFAALPADYVRRDVRVLQMLWTARQPMGLTALPRVVQTSAPHDRLAWLLGRLEIDGAEPAGIV